MAGRKAFTKDMMSRARAAFLATLSKTGQITAAAKSAGVVPRTAYNWRDGDPEFKKAWELALEDAADMLESVAIKRASVGVLKPVYQGGVKVGNVREYSDGLMTLLLKAHKPEKYRERSDVHVTGSLEISERLRKARERADGSA